MPASASSKIVPLFFDTYLSVIKRSEKINMFRNYYANVNFVRTDIMADGNLSCAFFVSAILKIFDLIQSYHATVTSTVVDMEKSNWTTINKLKIGSVIVWVDQPDQKGEMHKHIGFCILESEAPRTKVLGFLQKKGFYSSIHPWPNSPRFSRSSNKAISNNSLLGYPTMHNITFEPDHRDIEKILWNKKLTN